jgi:hypothetical protein
MPTSGERVKPSLRETLAGSHIAAIAIAVLLLWSIDWGFRALWSPLYRATTFLVTAVAIRDVPYIPSTPTLADRVMLVSTLFYLFGALACIAAAWLLSRWVYGVGLLRSLSKYRARLTGRNHA